MDISQEQEPDYDSVKIDYVGFVDPYAVEGMVVLKAENEKEFHMRAFSGEVAKHIASFSESIGREAHEEKYEVNDDVKGEKVKV